MEKLYYTYIMTNNYHNVLYIGVTNNLDRRYFEHRFQEKENCFTSKYNIKKLVYFEEYKYINDAIYREKQLKRWHRQWKINLITEYNPKWKNLAEEMIV